METEDTVLNYGRESKDESTQINSDNACSSKKVADQTEEKNKEEKNSNKTLKAASVAGVSGLAAGLGSAMAANTVSGQESPTEEQIPEDGDTHSSLTSQNQEIAGGDAPMATTVSDDMSFSQAFAAAREEIGPNGVFEWHGQVYTTQTAEEMASHEQMAEVKPVNSSSDVTDGQILAEVEVSVENVEPEIEVLGVAYDEESGATIGGVSVDGQEVIFVDIDGDGNADVMASDLNHDNQLSENEVIDVHQQQISMTNFEVQDDQSVGGYYADNTTPDYMDDGSADSFA